MIRSFSVTSFLLFSATVGAQTTDTEIIQIVAPKEAISLTTNRISNHYLDERFNFDFNRTIADQLISIPGVSLTGQGGQFQSYSIRGFSRSRIRTEIDGIPIITDRRAGNSVSFIAPELLSSGLVIKGPSSVLYGSQALGGVVSLTSVANEQSAQVSLQPANNGVNLVVNGHNDLVSTSVAIQHANNDTAPDGTALNTGFERISGVVKLNKNIAGIAATLSWLPSYGKNIGKSNAKYLVSEISQYPSEIHSLAQLQLSRDDSWTAKIFHHYQNWDSETLRIGEYRSLTSYQSHTLGGQWLAPLLKEVKHTYIGVDLLARAGVSIKSQYDVDSPELSEIPSSKDLLGDEKNVGIFAQHTNSLDPIDVTLGLRYDWIHQSNRNDAVSDSELSGSIAFKSNHDGTTHFEVDLASGFRFPTLSERYFNGRTPRGLIVGNPSLVPERSLGGEVSVQWTGSELIHLAGSLYHYEMDNYIERYRLSSDLLSYRNLDSAQISGIEAQVSWFQSDSIEHVFSYQYQQGTNATNETLADLIPQKLSWALLVSINDWQLSNSINYHAKTTDVGSTELPRSSYTIWNASAEYQVSPNVSVSLVVNNITNELYYASFDEDAPLQPERSIRLSSRWTF